MLDILSEVHLFEGIPLNGLSGLAKRGKRRSFPAGSRLMRQGQASKSLHVILRGRVRVERAHQDLTDPLLLSELGPGEVVGEMGVLDGERRSATVTALEDTETLEVTRGAVAQLVLAYPKVAGALLRQMSKRLRSASDLAEELARRVERRGAEARPARARHRVRA